MKNNDQLSKEIISAGHMPHCLGSMTCSKECEGCQNCLRHDGVAIEEYDSNGIIDRIGFYKPEHKSIEEAYYKADTHR